MADFPKSFLRTITHVEGDVSERSFERTDVTSFAVSAGSVNLIDEAVFVEEAEVLKINVFLMSLDAPCDLSTVLFCKEN